MIGLGFSLVVLAAMAPPEPDAAPAGVEQAADSDVAASTRSETANFRRKDSSIAPNEEAADAVIAATCPADRVTRTSKGITVRGCKRCPNFTTDAQAGFQLPDTEGAPPAFTLVSLLEGRFSQPRTHEVYAEFSGCEPHATEGGGSVLLRGTGRALAVVRYEPGLLISDCRRLRRRDSRELLVCVASHTAQGNTDLTVFVHDAATPDKPPVGPLVSLEDNTGAGTGDVYRAASVDDIELVDLNKDGTMDVVIRESSATAKVASSERDQDGLWTGKFVPPPKKALTAAFLFDGSAGFRAAPGSVAAKREEQRWHKAAGEQRRTLDRLLGQIPAMAERCHDIKVRYGELQGRRAEYSRKGQLRAINSLVPSLRAAESAYAKIQSDLRIGYRQLQAAGAAAEVLEGAKLKIMDACQLSMP